MNPDYYCYLRTIIPTLITSESMQAYLRENIEVVDKWDIINLILGSPIPLTEKKQIFHRLSAFECIDIQQAEGEDDDDYWMRVHDVFTLYDQYATEAINDLKPPASGFFLLRTYCWEEPAQHFTDCCPFCTVEDVLNYLERLYTGENISHIWHLLEKWERIDGELREIRDYCIVNNQICYFGDYTHHHHMPYCAHSADLNLPVPFKPGDFVIVDGQPFSGTNIAMITGVGDNHDCCCLQAVYLDYHGGLAYGAVKHAAVFETSGYSLFPLMSPLYRIEPFRGELPEELKPLLVLQKYLTGDAHLVDDIYFSAMMHFKCIDDITEEAMKTVHRECLVRYNQFIEERRAAAASKKFPALPTPKRMEKLIRKHLARKYVQDYAELILDGFEVDTRSEESLVLYTNSPMRCSIVRDRLLSDIVHIVSETYGICPEASVLMVE